MPAQSFWRNHNKPRVAVTQRVVSHTPAPGSVAEIRQIMRRAADDALASGLTRPNFAFEPSEVEAIYQHRAGVGDGLWFALIDGRIYSGLGDYCGNDHTGYE